MAEERVLLGLTSVGKSSGRGGKRRFVAVGCVLLARLPARSLARSLFQVGQSLSATSWFTPHAGQHAGLEQVSVVWPDLPQRPQRLGREHLFSECP